MAIGASEFSPRSVAAAGAVVNVGPPMNRRLSAVAVLLLATAAGADEAVALSGPKVGQRPMPYAFVLATGPNRGTAFCYICDTGDKPAAIVFARSLTDPLGKLAA